MGFRITINFILLSLLGILAFQNLGTITIRFFSDFSIPVAALIVILTLSGIIIGKLLPSRPGLNSKPGQISPIQTNSNINLFVGNLSRDISKSDLENAFSKYGSVTSVKIIKDKHSGNPRGFGFVEMKDAISANKAVDELNGYELHGKILNVKEAHPRTPGQRNQHSRQRHYR